MWQRYVYLSSSYRRWQCRETKKEKKLSFHNQYICNYIPQHICHSRLFLSLLDWLYLTWKAPFALMSHSHLFSIRLSVSFFLAQSILIIFFFHATKPNDEITVQARHNEQKVLSTFPLTFSPLFPTVSPSSFISVLPQLHSFLLIPH